MITQIASLTDEQIDSQISEIISAIEGVTERDFQRASDMYNSSFFRGMPIAFTVKVCRALNGHFLANTNNFWLKMSQNEYI
jgi:hypothetical protein